MRLVKFALPFALCLAFAMTACNTIENRRSLYAPKKADGPYTRSLQDGSWRNEKSVNEQYEESKGQRSKSKDAAPAPRDAAEPAIPS
jgi:hypothetical protein